MLLEEKIICKYKRLLPLLNLLGEPKKVLLLVVRPGEVGKGRTTKGKELFFAASLNEKAYRIF